MTAGSTATAIEEPIGDVAYPTKRNEAWRYAPHGDLGRLTFGPPTGTTVDVPAEVDVQIPSLEGPRIVIVNGVVDADRSDLGRPSPGLNISSLADAVSRRPQQVAAHIDPGLDGPADAFEVFNRAFGGDGAFVEIADHQALDRPIHVVDVSIPDGGRNGACAGVVIHIGEGTAATIVETRIGAGEDFGGSNVRTTITLGAGATLDHVVLQDAPAAQIHLARFEVTQAAGSEYRSRSFNLGAGYGRLAYDVHLTGEGARADLGGLYFGTGDQVLDQQITVVHGAENCTSRQAYRGVLDDASAGVFNGGIDVRPGADGTDAEQSNDNLLLSDRAEVNTQPRLEILADDVACKHGATVGQLDDNALYYLRSRGIAADDARRLLINGFADQAVDDVEIEAVKAWITERLGHALGAVPGDHRGTAPGDGDA